MAVSPQVDVWLGSLETINTLPRLGLLLEKFRWSALSIETVGAPGLLLGHPPTCPENLLRALDHDLMQSSLRSKSFLGMFTIGASEIHREIGNMVYGKGYLVVLNAIGSVLSPATAATLFKLLINERDPTTARQLEISTTCKTLNMVACSSVQKEIETVMFNLYTFFDSIFGSVDLDLLVTVLRGLSRTEKEIRLVVRSQTEIAIAVLSWACINAQVIVRDQQSLPVYLLGNNDLKRVELLIPGSQVPGTVVPTAQWVTKTFPYGIHRHTPADVVGGSYAAYIPVDCLIASLLRNLNGADPEFLRKNIDIAYKCIMETLVYTGSIDRARLDMIHEFDTWFQTQRDFSDSDLAQFCREMTDLFSKLEQKEMCENLKGWIRRNLDGIEREIDIQRERCTQAGPDESNAESGTQLLVAIILRALQRNIDGKFSIHGDWRVYTLRCIKWLEGIQQGDRTGCFLELVTGMTSDNIERGPILVGNAGVVMYNDFDLVSEPEKMKYFKVARGSAYLGDELVEYIEGDKPRCATPQFGDVDLLPIDMTPTDVKLAFQRDVGTFGFHKITVTINERRSSILNAAGALQIWSDLIVAMVGKNDIWERIDEDKMEEDEGDDGDWQPIYPRKTRAYSPIGIDPDNSEDIAVSASYRNPKGRAIACCAMREPETTFLLVDVKRETFDFVAKNIGAISGIVY